MHTESLTDVEKLHQKIDDFRHENRLLRVELARWKQVGLILSTLEQKIIDEVYPHSR